MTPDKLAEMADRIMDVATPTISSISTCSERADFRKIIWEEVAAALRTQGRSPPEILVGIEEVGTVLVGKGVTRIQEARRRAIANSKTGN